MKPTAAILGRPESHGRSLAKAVSWRAIGTADTFLWGWVITGHPAAAGAIASLETMTKIALYYLHERMWRLFRWAPNARLRSLAKALSWRLVGSIDTFTLSFLVTGSARYAVSIASGEALTKIALYYMHERVWRKVAWGRLDDKPGEDDAEARYTASFGDRWRAHDAQLREEERAQLRRQARRRV
jgi:uncharacterized membrane protein